MNETVRPADSQSPITPEIPPGQAEPALEPYWIERRRYIARIRSIPELRRRYFRAMAVYLLRRFLWSFGFFPVFLAFWLPLVMARFNPVALVNDALPRLQHFVESNPEVQAYTLESLFTAWLSVGFLFAVFDLVLTPFKSPYEYEADVHMRAWSQTRQRNQSGTTANRDAEAVVTAGAEQAITEPEGSPDKV